VGQVLKKLEEHGIKENTFVFFSSDNGPWLCMLDHGGSAGMLREGKQYTFEGGVRVPTVAMWPKVIKPGSVYDDQALMIDLFPTFSHIVGAALPDDRPIDGRDIYAVLSGEGKREAQDITYFYLDDYRCIRSGNWKYKKPFPGYEGSWWKKAVAAHGELLFNLKDDPGEKNNLADSLPDKLAEMKEKFDSLYTALDSLPSNLIMRQGADNSHIEHVKAMTSGK
jgi:arylsulfatase A-like enzyme